MKEYIKVLESIKQQFESAVDDGQNSTDIDAIEAIEDNALAIEALNMATQALIDFPAMLNQYLGENDQMIIGKDVYEELKYELETLKKSAKPQGDLISREAVLKEMDERHKNGDAITKGFIKNLPSVEPQEWISVLDEVEAEINGEINSLMGDAEYQSVIKGLRTALDAVGRVAKTYKPKSEWISVKKHGNPKEDGLYMVTVRGGFEETENDDVTTSHYIFDRGGWSVEDVDTEVTAWMPKPIPYKGE